MRYGGGWLNGSVVDRGDHWVEIEVWGQHPGETSLFVGEHAEWRAGSLVKYYHAGGQRVAMRTSIGLYYLLNDHLGSTSVTVQATGTTLTKVGELRYKPWGESRPMRYAESATPTDYRYTGQRAESEVGLYHYGARWYDPALGRFLSPDSIVPDPYNPLDWNRFGYARNNPVKYIDPDGHRVVDPDGYDGTHAGLMEDKLGKNPELLKRSQQYRALLVMKRINDTGLTWHGLHDWQRQILIDAGWNENIFNDDRHSQTSTADALHDPAAWFVTLVSFGRLGYRTSALIAEYLCVDGNCGNELDIDPHALQRMAERGVSIEQLQDTLQVDPFKYYHGGQWKLGYYDPVSRIFVAVVKNGTHIKTVIVNVKLQYIENLKKAIP